MKPLIIGVWLALLTVLSITTHGCYFPSQEDPSKYGPPVRVAIGDSLDDAGPWRSDQVPYIRDEIQHLSALGARWVESSVGSADVVIYRANTGAGCPKGAGWYQLGKDFVEVDDVCTGGYQALQAAIGHELMHWLTHTRYGYHGHVCQHEEGTDCHPTIRGLAMLNPSNAYNAEGACRSAPEPGNAGSCGLGVTVSQWYPTENDLALVDLLQGR